MRFVKWISLFFVDALLFFCIGFYYGFKTEGFFYPGEKPISDYQSPHIITPDTSADQAVSVEEKRLDKDTKYVVKTICLPNTEMSNQVFDLPYEYIGMDRQTFLMAIENLTISPPESEKENGFVSAFVESYSPERVKVTMYYEPQKSEYHLALYDNQVVVFEEDMSTIYMRTGIYVDDLSEETRLELINGILLHSEEELYKFLEAYSS